MIDQDNAFIFTIITIINRFIDLDTVQTGS